MVIYYDNCISLNKGHYNSIIIPNKYNSSGARPNILNNNMMVRGQTREATPATGQQFKIEAARNVPGPKKCCGAESYKNMFLVDEDLFPDPKLLKFIPAADFKQGLQRVNEMTDKFKDRGQSPIFKLGCLFCLPLLFFNIFAPTLINSYPEWALWIGWTVLVGLFVLLTREIQRQEAIFIENVEMGLKQMWNKAVAQGVGVKYSIERSDSQDRTWPAAVTITLP